MKKAWLIVAASLVFTGALLFVGALAATGFDFAVLDSREYVTSTYDIEETFDSISIEVETTDIRFVPSEDGTCRVVCRETEKMRHGVYVKDGTLVIVVVDTRRWYDHIGIFSDESEMTVYLPVDSTYALELETDTGDVDIAAEIQFSHIDVEGDTSDVNCRASAAGAIEIDVDTGDVTVEDITASGISLATNTGDIRLARAAARERVSIETDTGRIALTAIDCVLLEIESDTGDIMLEKVLVSGDLTVDSATGDVEMEGCDAENISIETSTGDVSGVLLSEKVFLTETATGRVRVPQTAAGGICRVTTSTGDISMSVITP